MFLLDKVLYITGNVKAIPFLDKLFYLLTRSSLYLRIVQEPSMARVISSSCFCSLSLLVSDELRALLSKLHNLTWIQGVIEYKYQGVQFWFLSIPYGSFGGSLGVPQGFIGFLRVNYCLVSIVLKGHQVLLLSGDLVIVGLQFFILLIQSLFTDIWIQNHGYFYVFNHLWFYQSYRNVRYKNVNFQKPSAKCMKKCFFLLQLGSGMTFKNWEGPIRPQMNLGVLK